MLQFTVNLLAVFIVSILGMIIGFLWYSPFLFGKLWMDLQGIDEKKMKTMKSQGMTASYIISFLSVFVFNYILAVIIRSLGAVTFAAGAQIGFFLWLGFFATIMLNSVLWEKKPLSLYVLNVAHYLLILILLSGILAVWM